MRGETLWLSTDQFSSLEAVLESRRPSKFKISFDSGKELRQSSSLFIMDPIFEFFIFSFDWCGEELDR